MKRNSSFGLFIILSVCSLTGSAQTDSAALCENSVKEYPVLFQQTAAEYRALCYQAFNAAARQIESVPARKVRRRHLVIVTDLDETILDNSYLEAQLIRDHQNYSGAAWKKWSDQAEATAVPGAVKFLQKAHQRGYEIFYVSNRKTEESAATLRNLKNLSLPDADSNHLYLRTSTSGKEPRREIIRKEHRIFLLMGDNLNDFLDIFEGKSIAERREAADSLQNAWGSRFIVLPNPTYGEWENALYKYNFRLSPAQKEAIRMELLKGYGRE